MKRPLKILVAHDGSPFSEAALEDLARAGAGSKAEALILTAVKPWLPPMSPLTGGEADAWYAETLVAVQRQSRKALADAKVAAEKAAARLRKRFPGWKVSARAAVRDPAAAILETAEKWKASLIVVGSKGHSALGRMLLGSVSHKVLIHAPCSARVARKPSSAKKAGPARVLVAVDGSKDSDAAVAAAASRAWDAKTEFRILLVVDYRLTMALNFETGTAATAQGWKEPAIRIAEKARKALAAKGLRATSVVREGEPRQEILREAARFKAGTILLGRGGMGALERFFVGSTSLAVAEHAPCSVEIVR